MKFLIFNIVVVMFCWHWHLWPLEWPEHEDIADLYYEETEYV